MAAEQELTDCHFYLLGSCNKGAECPFRHCPAAKRNKIECDNWGSPQGCSDRGCAFRHPSLAASKDKDRSTIRCYWETQPSGCLKGASCPFMHNKASGAFALAAPAGDAKSPSKRSATEGEKPTADSAPITPAAQRVVKINRVGSEKSPNFGIKTLDELKRAPSKTPSKSDSSESLAAASVSTFTAPPSKTAAAKKLTSGASSSSPSLPKPAAAKPAPAKPAAAKSAAPPASPDTSTNAAAKRKAPEPSAALTSGDAPATLAKAAAKAPNKAAKPSPKAAPAKVPAPAAKPAAVPPPPPPPPVATPAPAAPAPSSPTAEPTDEDELARLERELEEVGVTLSK